MATCVPSNGVIIVNFALELDMKVQKRSVRIALFILQPRHQVGVDGKLHAPAVLPPGEGPGTHLIGSCVGTRASLDGCGNSPALGFDRRNVRTVSGSYTD
jgi:hypothetical protein